LRSYRFEPTIANTIASVVELQRHIQTVRREGVPHSFEEAFSVAASGKHYEILRSILETLRGRSIKSHAAGIAPPADMDSQVRLVNGTSHLADHCAACHSAPGVEA
jgi:hypothetical protein